MRVAREAVGPEGRVVPQQWLAHTTAPRVADGDHAWTSSCMGPRCTARHFAATPLWCSPLRADGAPVPGAAVRDGVALQHARRRNPELQAAGPHRLAVLPCEVGGRWAVKRAACAARLSADRMEAPPCRPLRPGRR